MSLQIANEILDWICVIMFILGTLGNTLSTIVFSSRKFRRTTYGRLAIASLIINLLCIFRYSLLFHSKTRRWITYSVGQTWLKCKIYRLSSCLRILSAFIIVAWIYERFTDVTVNCKIYFYRSTNSSYHGRYSYKIGDSTNIHSYQSIYALKESVSLIWRSFLNDVRFCLNYTTLRSIFSEIIPSILVIGFDIGIIAHVVQSASLLSANSTSTSVRPSNRTSFQVKNGVDGLMVHNRPRTSWMNIVLIIHSFLFCFSSVTATLVHWSTSNMFLSYCEIRKLFYRYFQLYCFGQLLNLFRTKSEREENAQIVRTRLVRHRSTIIPPQSIAHLRGASFAVA
ncbi:unnamed protein product [Adineta steineri]|uniref:Uncharacterized protein n=1 Tax=Adineta steineri TaxID=433720 RepID=A0A819Z4J6_9BILA|nr:unnamed protein product [Adineta steineri]CAF4168479.1 unnamed protein product [Adineta steineri]